MFRCCAWEIDESSGLTNERPRSISCRTPVFRSGGSLQTLPRDRVQPDSSAMRFASDVTSAIASRSTRGHFPAELTLWRFMDWKWAGFDGGDRDCPVLLYLFEAVVRLRHTIPSVAEGETAPAAERLRKGRGFWLPKFRPARGV